MYGLKNVRNRRTDSLSRVGWDQLESLLAIYYRGQGFRVDHVGTGASGARFDGGIDLKLYKDNEYVVVQCKHWNAKQVPHNDVHQLLGIMVNEGATGAILVTSGEFTAYALEAAAKQGHVQLIDGDALREMIGPLPEPEASAPVASTTRSVAAHVGDRLLGAAEDRIRGHARGHRRSGTLAKTTESLLLVKVLLPIAFAGVIAIVMVSVIKSVISGLQPARSAPAAQSAESEPLPRPSGEAPAVMDVSSDSVQAGWYAGAASDNTPPRRQTAAEIRESQRRADEAIRLLEATTPEM